MIVYMGEDTNNDSIILTKAQVCIIILIVNYSISIQLLYYLHHYTLI